jgi:hypothetical protein
VFSPLSLFGVQEWATHRQEGHECPSCHRGVLQLVASGSDPDDSSLACSVCELTHVRPGWYRHYWASQKPIAIGGQVIHQGPLFATIQHWTRKPDGDPNQLQLADFYLDIDREHFADALYAARAYAAYFDRHQVPYRAGFSGKKGFWLQVPWQAMGAVAMPMLHERVYRRVANVLQEQVGEPLDMKLYSPARMFRVENTRHGDTGLYKIAIPDPLDFVDARHLAQVPAFVAPPSLRGALHGKHPLREMLMAAVVENHETTEHEKRRPAGAKLSLAVTGQHVACVERALQEGPPYPGSRNALNMNMAAYFADLDDETLLNWAKNVPGASKTPASVRVGEMRSTLRWARRSGATFSCHAMRDLDLCDPRCPFYPLSASYGEVPAP